MFYKSNRYKNKKVFFNSIYFQFFSLYYNKQSTILITVIIMQQLQEFLQEKIAFDDLDLNLLIEQAELLTDPNSSEYRLLELTLNQLLTQYLEKAKKYIIK